MTISEQSSKIIKQVEFYFGDANFPRDKFLQQKASENADGWIPLSTVASFSRMKKLSEDEEIIKEALSSTESSIYELGQDKSMIRRKGVLPIIHDVLSRSVYIKGFPQKYDLDDILAVLTPHSSKIEAIRMRRNLENKEFKGSVFVEFSTEEEATRFTGLSISIPQLDAEKESNNTNIDSPLLIKSKMAYFEDKNSERTNKKSSQKQASFLEKMGSNHLVVLEEVPVVGEKQLDHESIKEALKDEFPVAYVDFAYQPGKVWIRFREAIADVFAKKYSGNDNSLVIEEVKLNQFRLPTETEQGQYYEAVLKPRNNVGKKLAFSKGAKKSKETELDTETVNCKRVAPENDGDLAKELDGPSAKKAAILVEEEINSTDN